jgi:allantoinase
MRIPLDLPVHDRDFVGHAGASPVAHWPNGARMAVSIVVNVEEGAELSLGMGDEANEHVYEAVERVEGVRDLCMESHFEYGTRAGWPRLRRLLAERRVSATMNASARALAVSPWLAQQIVEDGHEICAHGWRWERHANLPEDEERAVIARAYEAIREASGKPPVGWHTRSATSPNTRRLLLEHGGFLYDSNAYDDDLPYIVADGGADHVVVPYAFDTNDMRFLNNGGFVHGEDFARYCIAAFDRLYAESASGARMMSIGLHLRIIGRPARIGGLEWILDHICAHEGVWLARRDHIAAAWREICGLPVWTSRAKREGGAHD